MDVWVYRVYYQWTSDVNKGWTHNDKDQSFKDECKTGFGCEGQEFDLQRTSSFL